ncbi:MAG: type II toxin-antitoxin system VapC family toxin [Alphaproteobacteria bacterium]|nr:type II toxin-antitoxin system VapC family toxin [Alphaproteobacteria bacterium]
MATLADANVLLDVATNDPEWADWSINMLEGAALQGPLLINDVVYAELSVRFERIEDLNLFVGDAGLVIDPMPKEALFLAGKVFLDYKRNGGRRSGVLPDFFIGAHAMVAGHTLLTRNTKRYLTYFPGIALAGP